MERLQFYKYATWSLLLLNLSMVAFFLLTAPPPHQGQGPDRGGRGAVDIMNLEEEQHDSFLQFAHRHMEQIEDFNSQQRNALKPYFHTLIGTDKNLNVDSLLREVQSLERKKIESTYQHFQEIKSILKPSQYADFEKFIEQVLARNTIGKKKRPSPPKDWKK